MLALVGFVFLGLFSPGPNVVLLTASGARFGFRATLPHLAGVVLGVGVTAFVTGLGLGALLETVPGLRLMFSVIAALWIVVMAYSLWHAEPSRGTVNERPFTLVEAILFQWVNPKVWAVAMAAMAYVEFASPLYQALVLGVTFSSINLVVCLFWTATGSRLSVLRSNPGAWRTFMRVMSVALVGFSVLVFL